MARYLLLAISRRFSRARLGTNAPEVCVVSAGGVGTTAIIDHIGRFRRLNAKSDSDGLKHLPRPPLEPAGCAVRYLFITGPEADIQRSLERRGWLRVQAAKLGAPLAVVARGRLRSASFAAAVRRQRTNWKRAPASRLLVLDYDEIWDAAPSLAEFLSIRDPAFIAEYPRRRVRSDQAATARAPDPHARERQQ